jgi:DNA-binding winged helix-turn-helix (wHTH) protein
MTVAACTAAQHRRRPATVLPPTGQHQQPAATHTGPARMGTGYSLLAVVLVDASTTLAIVGHLLRTPRPDSPPPPTPAPSGLVVDRECREARIGATTINLTFQEFELLGFLASHPGKVFSAGSCSRTCGEREQEHGTRTVDVHVHRLRRKLGAEYGQCLVTMRHIGYKFTPPAAQPDLASPSPHRVPATALADLPATGKNDPSQPHPHRARRIAVIESELSEIGADNAPLPAVHAHDGGLISPRRYAGTRRRGTLYSRPPRVMGTRSTGAAFHWARRCRVRLRDFLRLGTAMFFSLILMLRWRAG